MARRWENRGMRKEARMPIVRKAAVICDRCGAVQEFDPQKKDPLMSRIGNRGTDLDGWEAADGGKCLCPICASEYREMVERHKSEMREFMGTPVIEFEI